MNSRADLGFSIGGGLSFGGGAHDVANVAGKTYKIKKILVRVDVRGAALRRSANAFGYLYISARHPAEFFFYESYTWLGGFHFSLCSQ